MQALAIAAIVARLLPGTMLAGRGERPERNDDIRNLFGLAVEAEGESREQPASAGAGERSASAADGGGYRVFTTRHDREDSAEALLRTGVRAALRERLDGLVASHAINRPRLVRALAAVLARPADDGWEGGQEEGLIDGRRLAQLVAAPAERRLLRRERSAPAASAAVTFLIDCSGSMKEHAPVLAVLVDTFARALEQAGAACEVLGFTTAAWNGGRARRDWLRAGRPASPGRLNERAHIVFKGADVPWRRARQGIAALLHGELFREGIDGEAVEWASGRLAGRDDAEKILFVVSDGAPMDAATRLANGAHFLDHHLARVAARIERAGDIALFGVGVGLDLSAFYRRSHVLDLGGAIGNAMCDEVVGLLAGRRLPPAR